MNSKVLASVEWLLLAIWLALLAFVFARPQLTASPTPGDDLTRHTVRVSLLFYVAAVILMLGLSPAEWSALDCGRIARCCWSLAWLAFVIHVGVAFHYYHDWSHANAVAHVRAASGVGEGIFVSYSFTLVWTLDVACWWIWPAHYASRPPWCDRLLHGFMAFIIFCGTVVYEEGLIRWCGALMFVVLGLLWLWRMWIRMNAICEPPA